MFEQGKEDGEDSSTPKWFLLALAILPAILPGIIDKIGNEISDFFERRREALLPKEEEEEKKESDDKPVQ